MRHETLLKIIIATFAIILIILGTFVYGNIQRSKQTNKGGSNQATVQSPKENENTNNSNSDTPTSNTPTNQSSSNASQNSAPQSNPVAPTNTPAPNTTTNIPTTGANEAVIPMTVLSTLAYLTFRSRKNNSLSYSKNR